jgi:hypothetical protein
MKIDACFKEEITMAGNGPSGEVWLAQTYLEGGHQFKYLFAAELEKNWIAKPSDLWVDKTYGNYWAFETSSAETLVSFSNQSPLTLQTAMPLNFSMWTIIPIEANGWALQGETMKWVSVSSTRFLNLSLLSSVGGGLEVLVAGSTNESIEVSFVRPAGTVVMVKCVFVTDRLLINSNGVCV